MANAKRALPEGHRTITPQLTLDNAAQAIDWYEKAPGAEEVAPEGNTVRGRWRRRRGGEPDSWPTASMPRLRSRERSLWAKAPPLAIPSAGRRNRPPELFVFRGDLLLPLDSTTSHRPCVNSSPNSHEPVSDLR